MIRDPQIANISSQGYAKLQSPTFIGEVNTNGAFTSSSISSTNGYTFGAGGSVTQTGSHTSSVTLNRPTGRILGFSQAKNANVPFTYVLINNTISPGDTIILSQYSTSFTTFDTFSVWLSAQVNAAGGYARIQILPRDSATWALNLNFSVIRGSAE